MWCVDKLTSIARVINGCIDTLVEVKACKGFDDRFDIFWDELRGRNKGLLCVRNRKYLDWRFKHAILNNRVWLLVAERESRIVGYVILKKDDKSELSLKRMKVVDMQIVDNDTETMNKLISHSINKCSTEGIDMLEMIGFNTIKRDCLKRYLPYKRQLPVWPFYLAKDNQVADELEKPDIWELCLFDGDGSF
jgi:hypothetical protein